MLKSNTSIFALELNKDGLITRIIRNDFKIKLNFEESSLFDVYIDRNVEESFNTILQKLDLIQVTQIPILLMNSKKGIKDSNFYQISAVKIEAKYIIIGEKKKKEDFDIYDELITIQNEQINEIRSLEKRKIQNIADPRENLDIKAFTELNNQLLNAQRQLVKKNRELELAMSEIKTLREILPICSNCKKIRNDKGDWTEIDDYFREHTQTEFSHGLCRDCLEKLYPDFVGKNKK